jgi:hypothetical protein
MSREPMPNRWHGLENPPSDVEVTVLADPARCPLFGRIARLPQVVTRARSRARARAIAGLALVVAAAVVALGGVAASERGGAAPRSSPTATDRGAAGVAAAYGFPRRCLAVTMLGNDPTYARADFNRASPCGRYDGIATAIFHRADGVWRPALVAATYSCPVRSLPRAVQVQLGVCQ